MKQLDKEEQQLLDLLPKGIERPRPLKELVKLTGWSNRRVRGIINRLIVIHHRQSVLSMNILITDISSSPMTKNDNKP